MRANTINFVLKLICIQALTICVAGCATATLETSGSLSSYEGLAAADGLTTKSKLRVDKAEIMAAKSVSIIPTSFSGSANQAALSAKQRRVIANAVDRSVCIGLSDRFVMVPPGQPSDLTVHVTVTHVNLTDPSAAGASKVASAVPMFLSLGFPVVVPRIPYGLGGLSVEAEARDAQGQQRAAFVWARDADVMTSSPRVDTSGDAYDLAAEFGTDFSKLLNTGDSPFDHKPSIPSIQRINSTFGGKPKYTTCDAFGRTGLTTMIGAKFGAPPEWNDDAQPVAE